MRNQLLIMTVLLLAVSSTLAGSNKPLNITADGTFKILMMTDLHFGENLWNDLLAVSLETFLIKHSDPNFVVLDGDQVSGYAWIQEIDYFNTFYQRQWEMFTFPIWEHKKEYCMILGNHDAEGNLNRSQIIHLDTKNHHSHTQPGPDHFRNNGGNYYLPIYSKYEVNKVVAMLWFFDSGNQGCMQLNHGWGCVEPEQVTWYEAEAAKVKQNHGDDLLHLAFIHIPVPEFVTLYNEGEVYGMKQEDVCCPMMNSGIFEALKKNNVKAIFSGHDHNNDFGGVYQGVELVYGRKTGFGCYGPPKDVNRGARVISLEESYNPVTKESKVTYSHKILDSKGNYIENGLATKRLDKLPGCRDTESDKYDQPINNNRY